MERSIADLILQQRIRMETLALLAGRFMDEQAQASIRRLSGRMARVGATLSAPSARQMGVGGRVQGQLERLVREVGTARLDDHDSIARIAWVLADIEEAIRQTPVDVVRPVYTAN